jgi:hypothetical protein
VKVFTDLQQPNMLDPTPWIDIDLLQPKGIDLDALRKLRKSDFSVEDIIAHAERTVYFRKMADFVTSMLREPSEAFVRFVAGDVFPSVRLMPKVIERLSPILKDAIQAAVLDSVAKSFATPPSPPETGIPPAATLNSTTTDNSGEREKSVVTTAEETQCFEMISHWIHEMDPDATVVPRDSQQYFAVNQGNVRTWFVRFNVQTSPYWIAFRHLSPEDLKNLVPSTEPLVPASFGDSRASLSGVPDVTRFKIALISAYKREATRRGADVD